MVNIRKKLFWDNILRISCFIVLVYLASLQGSDPILLLFLLVFLGLSSKSKGFIHLFATKSLSLFFAIGISYIFPLTNTQRGLIGLALLLALHLSPNKWKLTGNSATNAVYVLFGLEAIYFLLTSFWDRALQFMLYGYDNAFHFSLFRLYTSSQQFPNSFNENWPSDFVLFKQYSGGFYAVASFLSSTLSGQTADSRELVVGYFMAIILFFIGIWFTSIIILKSFSTTNFHLVVFCLSIALISSVGILLTNGYPPYLYALLILCLLLMRLCNTRNFGEVLIWTSVGFHLILISQPLVSWNLIPLFLFLFISFIKKLLLKQIVRADITSISLSIFLGLITFLMVSETANSFSLETLLVVGAVQPLTIEYWIAIFILFVFVLYFSSRNRKLDVSTSLIISVSVPFIFLVFLTFIETGSVGYYAIKQGYIWSYFVCIGSILVFQLEKLQLPKMGNFALPNLANFMLLVLIFASLQGSIAPKVFTGAFMGTVKNVTLATVGPKTSWPDLGLDAPQLIEAAKLAKSLDSECLLYRRNQKFTDLGSRWLNALSTNRVTEACFAVYWNSDALSDLEVADRIKSSGIKVQVISSQDRLPS